MPLHDEKQLLALLATGNENALKIIYLKYWESLFVSAYNLLKDRDACEDIIQEVFVDVWERRATLTIRSSLSAYLFTAVRYQVFHHIKHSAVRSELFENLVDRVEPGTPDLPLHLKELQVQITVAVNNLPEKCREIYKLSREEHLSYKEIARYLRISPKTVENQLAIALKKLRQALGHFLLSFLWACAALGFLKNF